MTPQKKGRERKREGGEGKEGGGWVGVNGYMQTRLSSNMQEPALLRHKSASELRQRERSSFDSKWVRDSCQRHRGRLCKPRREPSIDQD